MARSSSSSGSGLLPTFLATWGNGQHGRLGHAPASLGSELLPRLVAGLREGPARRLTQFGDADAAA